MVAMARALMPDPQVLLLDEPSAGLAPAFVEAIFQKVEDVNRAGVTIVMVEQNARRARDVQPRLRARPRAGSLRRAGEGAGRPQGRRALSRRDGRVDEPEKLPDEAPGPQKTKRPDLEAPARLSNRVAARARDYSGGVTSISSVGSGAPSDPNS